MPRFRRLVRLALAAGLPAAALAAPSAAAEICPAIDPPAVPAHAAAVRAFIDPVTGKLRPATPEERRKAAAAASLDRSQRSYEIVLLPDGTRVVPLDDAFLMTVRATRNPDGTVSHACRTGAAGSSTGSAK